MAYPLTKCLTLSLIIAIVICAIQIISSIAVMVDFKMVLSDYESNGADMVEKALNGSESNFNETSAWFVALSAEYDALSNFDKENVYCDVQAIQSNPIEFEYVGDQEWTACITLVMFAGMGFVLITGDMCCRKCNKFYDVDMADIKADPEDPKKAVIAASHWNKKPPTKEEQLKKNLSDFRCNTAYLFLAAGPLLAVFWIMMERRSMVSGFDCQALFYACGKSGECGMDDLMLTVPLNSSLIAMITSYPIITWGVLACLVSLLYCLMSGILITCGSGVFGFLWLPVFMFFYSLTPFAWVYFVDELVDFENAGLVGIFVLLMLAFLGEIMWVCVYVCRSCKGATF